MTTFFGLIEFSGRPLERASVEAMREATRANPGDIERAWHRGNVALGCNLRWITPESKTEILPLARPAAGGERVIIACARIDNRKELADKLGIAANEAKTLGDSEFILRAYEKWGENCVDHLLGDFAFAIWDQLAGRVFCARDHMGIQPLFYRTLGNQLIIANNIEPLTQECFPAAKLSHENVGSYLRDGENFSLTDTFLEGISQLPPGNYLIADDTGVRRKQYWSFEDAKTVQLSDVDEYSEMLSGLLKDAVRCRVRSKYQIGSHLSGGLDTAAIVATARSTGAVDADRLTTFSWLYTPKLPEERQAPEWSMARQIAETYSLSHVYTDYGPDEVLELLSHHDIAMGDTVDVWSEKILARNAAGMGVRSMVSGWGGDQLITHYGNDVYAERVLRGGVFPSLLELARVTRRNGSLYSYPINVYRMVLHPLFRASTSPHGSRKGVGGLNYLDFARPELIAKTRKTNTVQFYNGVRLRNQQLCPLRRSHLHNRISSWAVSGRAIGLSYVYPLLDKRIVEMAIGIPFELYRKNDIARYLFKRSVRHLKPADFWLRDQKTEPYRVAKSASLYVQASKKWVEQREIGACIDPFIDEERLVAEIEKLSYHKDLANAEFYRKLMAITRSMLVMGLRSHF